MLQGFAVPLANAPLKKITKVYFITFWSAVRHIRFPHLYIINHLQTTFYIYKTKISNKRYIIINRENNNNIFQRNNNYDNNCFHRTLVLSCRYTTTTQRERIVHSGTTSDKLAYAPSRKSTWMKCVRETNCDI